MFGFSLIGANSGSALRLQRRLQSATASVVRPDSSDVETSKEIGASKGLIPIQKALNNHSELLTQRNIGKGEPTTGHADVNKSTILSPVPDRKLVPLHSEWLLHEMGSRHAARTEMQVTSQSSVAAAPCYVPDGRTPTVGLTIFMHDGEVRVPPDRFSRLRAAH